MPFGLVATARGLGNRGEGCLEGASLRGVRGALVRPPGHATLCHRHSRAAPCAAQPTRSSRPEIILIAEAAVRYLLIKEDQDGHQDAVGQHGQLERPRSPS